MAATDRARCAMSRRWRTVVPGLALVPLVLGGGHHTGVSTRRAFADTATTAYDVAGLRVIQRQFPESEVVAVRLYVLGGARQVTAETAGIEALLFRAVELGTEREMARAGGTPIRSVGVDWSVMGFVSLRQDFDSVWTVFANRLLQPLPSDEAIARARTELVSAARRRTTHPDLRVSMIAQLVAFPEHPYGIEVGGTEQSLTRLTRASLEQYAAEQLVTSRMLLVVVGAISRGELESRVAATLGRLPRGEYRWSMPPAVSHQSSSWLTEHRPLPTNYILGYFAGPPPTHDDYLGFLVATHLLSGGLAQVVRDRRSLSYAVYAPFLDRAIPIGGIYASTQRPALVYQLMREQIADLQADELHPEALRRFVSQFTLDELQRQMSKDGQADALGRAELYFGDYRAADEYLSRLQSVRPSNVRRAAIKYMKYLQLAYLGDTTRMEGKW